MSLTINEFKKMIVNREEPAWLSSVAKEARRRHHERSRERRQFQKMRGGRTTMCKKVEEMVYRNGFSHMSVGHIFHCAHCKDRFTGPESLCSLFDEVFKRERYGLKRIHRKQDIQLVNDHVEKCARCWRIRQETLEEEAHDCLRFRELLEYALQDPGWLETRYEDVKWFFEHKNIKCGKCHRLFNDILPDYK